MLTAEVEEAEDVEESLFAFQRRTSAYPTQSLRYSRDPRGEPLWAGAEGRMPSAPPPCARCGAPRVFELQVMPQLVADLEQYMESDMDELAVQSASESQAGIHLAGGLDWGVLAVYTCSASCALADGCAYSEEHSWHQSL